MENFISGINKKISRVPNSFLIGFMSNNLGGKCHNEF